MGRSYGRRASGEAASSGLSVAARATAQRRLGTTPKNAPGVGLVRGIQVTTRSERLLNCGDAGQGSLSCLGSAEARVETGWDAVA